MYLRWSKIGIKKSNMFFWDSWALEKLYSNKCLSIFFLFRSSTGFDDLWLLLCSPEVASLPNNQLLTPYILRSRFKPCIYLFAASLFLTLSIILPNKICLDNLSGCILFPFTDLTISSISITLSPHSSGFFTLRSHTSAHRFVLLFFFQRHVVDWYCLAQVLMSQLHMSPTA